MGPNGKLAIYLIITAPSSYLSSQFVPFRFASTALHQARSIRCHNIAVHQVCPSLPLQSDKLNVPPSELTDHRQIGNIQAKGNTNLRLEYITKLFLAGGMQMHRKRSPLKANLTHTKAIYLRAVSPANPNELMIARACAQLRVHYLPSYRSKLNYNRH